MKTADDWRGSEPSDDDRVNQWVRAIQADALHWAAMVILDDRGEIAAYEAIKVLIARLERGEDGQT
jgi:hypothetical protein